MIDNRGAGEQYAPLLTLDNATSEHCLLSRGVFEPVRLVHDNGLEDVDVAVEYNIFERECFAALDVPHKELLDSHN